MVSRDLESERTTDPRPYNDFLYDEIDRNTQKLHQEHLISDPAFNQGIKVFDYSRGELINLGLQRNARFLELIKNGEIDMEKHGGIYQYTTHTLSAGMHLWMFCPTIEDLGTPEQITKWAVPARAGRITGSYNQTELGHGSDIQRLETTATYDPETQEFILHSPTISSTKVWGGGLGFSSTYTVTQAQLYTQGKHVGLQTFVVQIRDIETREALPGIEVGELGPKIGFNGLDNGWLRFNQHRIPRENMLSKMVEIAPDGTFTQKITSQLAYASMLRIRAGIVTDSAVKLAKAAVITTRYSVLRRQFPTKDGEERKVLDYQMQATRVLTQLANAYIFKIASYIVIGQLQEVIEETKEGNLDNLGQFHSELACMKVFCSKIAQEGIEVLRQCCGGHGYSAWSGLPHLWSEQTARVTYEGDNHMLFMQTSRKLLKVMAGVFQQQSIAPAYAFLTEDATTITTSTPELFFDPLTLSEILKSWTIKKLQYILMTWSPEEIAEQQIEMYEATFAHFLYRQANMFSDHINQKAEASIKRTLQHILTTFVVTQMLPYVGSLQALGVFQSPDIYIHMQKALRMSIAEIRQSAVALTDAFNYSDEELLSAIGCYDGDAYKRLFECYKGSRMNLPGEREKIDGALKYLKPLAKL